MTSNRTVIEGASRLWTLRLPAGESWILLQSDTHEDSPYCRGDLIRDCLDRAVERRAVVLHFGDLFDAMGGVMDPRRTESGIHWADKRDAYFDAIVHRMAERRASWPLPGLFGLGNHETSVLRHHQTDILARFVEAYSAATRCRAVRAGYDGYVRIHAGNAPPVLLYWHHGSGGSAPVTRGVIKTARRAVYLPDPDIVVSGHLHHAWCLPIAREIVSDTVGRRLQWHLQCPGYLDCGSSDWGFYKKNELAPTPFGSWWLRLLATGDHVEVTPIPEFA